MPELTAQRIARGGRPALKRQCATEKGYGSTNSAIINKIIGDFRKDQEYDPRFDFRNINDNTMTEHEARMLRNMDDWEVRNRLGL